MKTLIVLAVGLLAVGCATVKDIGVHLGGGKPNSTKAEPAKELTPTDQNASKAKPVTELTPEQKRKVLRDSVDQNTTKAEPVKELPPRIHKSTGSRRKI